MKMTNPILSCCDVINFRIGEGKGEENLFRGDERNGDLLSLFISLSRNL